MLSGVIGSRVRGGMTRRTRRRTELLDLSLRFLRRIKKTYWIFGGAVFLTGVISTQIFQSSIEDTRENIERMQIVNQDIYNKNIELRATRAHLNSKDHIVSLAQNRFDLFEPEKKQVHLIHM